MTEVMTVDECQAGGLSGTSSVNAGCFDTRETQLSGELAAQGEGKGEERTWSGRGMREKGEVGRGRGRGARGGASSAMVSSKQRALSSSWLQQVSAGSLLSCCVMQQTSSHLGAHLSHKHAFHIQHHTRAPTCCAAASAAALAWAATFATPCPDPPDCMCCCTAASVACCTLTGMGAASRVHSGPPVRVKAGTCQGMPICRRQEGGAVEVVH